MGFQVYQNIVEIRLPIHALSMGKKCLKQAKKIICLSALATVGLSIKRFGFFKISLISLFRGRHLAFEKVASFFKAMHM